MDLDFDIKSNLVTTVFTFVVWAVLQYLVNLFQHELLQLFPLTLQSVTTLGVAFVLVFGIYMILGMRRSPVVGVQAYLFFPKETPEKDRTMEYHKTHFDHRVIVNFKTTPPFAFYLPVDSYAWKLIKKHPELRVVERDFALRDADYVRKWCEKRKYKFESRVASRNDLLLADKFNVITNLDPRLVHVEWRFFLPFYYRFLPKDKVPSRRSILNWSTMRAFPLDSWTMKLLVAGKIRGSSVIAMPTLHYVQKWAKDRGFEWYDRLPTMKDLLMKKGDNNRTEPKQNAANHPTKVDTSQKRRQPIQT